ncbi:MAG: nucleotidyltransferase substrate binding protein [Candidatus Aminicenantes bacterium]|nr:nucleotidyltransferase substrate binding protein [Candidatus Aminicenantes bacterium]
MQKELILKQFNDIEKAKELFSASVTKFVPYDTDQYYTPDELEYYDSLAFRFEKCVELTINFFRSLELFLYAKQSDTLRDRLLKMQKINIIEDIDFWMESRLLRNKISHAYLPEEIKDIYQEIYDRSKEIFKTIDRIKDFISK